VKVAATVEGLAMPTAAVVAPLGIAWYRSEEQQANDEKCR
jgi:hypothetical protein